MSFCGNATLYAQTTNQSITVDSVTYTDNKVCYWQITTNRTSIAVTDTIKIILSYAFAADVYFLNGATIETATNMTIGKSGYTYTFPLQYLGATNTVWMVTGPEP